MIAVTPQFLIVDDCATVRLHFRSLLARFGWGAVEVSTSSGALAILRSDVRVDGLLIDYHLREAEGPTGAGLVALIRAHHRKDVRRLPIIMVTSDAHAQRVAYAAGVDGFLSKPVEAAAFKAAIVRALAAADQRTCAERAC